MSKKQRSLLLTLLTALILTIGVTATTTLAASKPFFPAVINLHTEMPKEQEWYGMAIGNEKFKGTISNLKSSKTSIVKVKWEKIPNAHTVIWFKPMKKPGTSIVSFKVKTGNKTYSYKVKARNWKYTNPIKTLKIGNTNFATKYKNTPYIELNKKQLSGKLTLKLNNGWELRGYNKIIIRNMASTGKEKIYNKAPSNITLKRDQQMEIYARNRQYDYEIRIILHLV